MEGNDSIKAHGTGASVESIEISRRLQNAKRQAFLRQMRLRVPAILIGFCSNLVGAVFSSTSTHDKLGIGWAAGSSLSIIGFFVAIHALLPNDRRALPAVVGLAVKSENCTHVDVSVPSWYCSILVGTEALMLVLLFSGTLRLASLLIWRLPTPKLFQAHWSTVGILFVAYGLVQVPRLVATIVMAMEDGTELELDMIPGFIVIAVSSTTGCTMLFATGSSASVQLWFMSRGESAVMAAGIAQLLGCRDIDTVLSSARETFFYVRADRLSFEDVKENTPNPDLARLAEKGRLGQADVFLSHSWHDDPLAKWDMLQSFRQEFKAKHKREPTMWIDKYCIKQNDIEESLACLPVYLAGCRKLLVLCGESYLQRLWCLIEVYIFLEMGGLRSNLEVRLCNRRANLTNILKGFDPRNARCSSNEDTERLHKVIQATGYDGIRKLVQDLFLRQCTQDTDAEAPATASIFSAPVVETLIEGEMETWKADCERVIDGLWINASNVPIVLATQHAPALTRYSL